MTVNAYGPLFETKTVTPAIRKAAQAALTYGITAVKAKTPVLTGLLRSQWEGKLEGNGVRMINNAPYAIYVEMGTRNMPARAMLQRTMPEMTAVFQKRLAAEIGKTMAAKVIGSIDSMPERSGKLYESLTEGRSVSGNMGFGPLASGAKGKETHMNQRRYGLK